MWKGKEGACDIFDFHDSGGDDSPPVEPATARQHVSDAAGSDVFPVPAFADRKSGASGGRRRIGKGQCILKGEREAVPEGKETSRAVHMYLSDPSILYYPGAGGGKSCQFGKPARGKFPDSLSGGLYGIPNGSRYHCGGDGEDRSTESCFWRRRRFRRKRPEFCEGTGMDRNRPGEPREKCGGSAQPSCSRTKAYACSQGGRLRAWGGACRRGTAGDGDRCVLRGLRGGGR